MSLLEQLAAELGTPTDTLRAALLDINAGEALQPSYLTIDDAGRVGAQFSGHLSATGIDLQAGTSGSSKIEWFDDNGALVAEIYGDKTGDGINELVLHVSEDPTTGLAQVNAIAGPVERLILDQAGNSLFVQSGEFLRVARGTVLATGVSQAGGGYASGRTGGKPVGGYTITYNTPFVATVGGPSVLITPGATLARPVFRITASDVAHFDVELIDGATGALADSSFRFAAFGNPA